MSTQPPSLPFSSSHIQHPFKLLELPVELLSLLESDSRPPFLTLTTAPSTSQALLKTPIATYQLRQKNTSNPIMVLTTSASYIGQTNVPNGDELMLIGKCEDTVELLEAPEEEGGMNRSVTRSKGKWHERFAREK